MNSRDGIWFIYDGECPLCNFAAHAFRIRQEYGSLHLLDARADANHPLLQEVNRRGLDLDAGMVIVLSDNFYHGKSALHFMAKYADDSDWFNRVNRTLFRSRTLAALLYPWMRGVRNVLIAVRGKGRINNLNHKNLN